MREFDIFNVINRMLLTNSDGLIEEDMFSYDNIESVEVCNSLILVQFYGINGSIPLRFFSPKGQKKVHYYMKMTNNKLWKVLNE